MQRAISHRTESHVRHLVSLGIGNPTLMD